MRKKMRMTALMMTAFMAASLTACGSKETAETEAKEKIGRASCRERV